MDNQTLIRIHCEPIQLNLIERAELIYDLHLKICNFLNIEIFNIGGGAKFSLNQKSEIIQKILKKFKNELRSNTGIKTIEDSHYDQHSSDINCYFTVDKNTSTSFAYSLGAKDDYLNKKMSLIIRDYENIALLKTANDVRSFLIFIVELFNPISIEIIDMRTDNDLNQYYDDTYWFGWMTYFSNKINLHGLPSEMKMEKLSNGGNLIITTEEIFDPKNNEHALKVRKLANFFKNNGLM